MKETCSDRKYIYIYIYVRIRKEWNFEDERIRRFTSGGGGGNGGNGVSGGDERRRRSQVGKPHNSKLGRRRSSVTLLIHI